MANYETLQLAIDAGTTNMTAWVNGTKYDDTVLTHALSDVNWFKFNNTTVDTIWYCGNTWVGFTGSSEQFKVNRVDAAMYYFYYETGTICDCNFFKLRWSGYSYYNTTSSSYKLEWELFVFDNDKMYLRYFTVPTSNFTNTNALTSSGGTVSFNSTSGTPCEYTFTATDSTHNTWTVTSGQPILQDCFIHRNTNKTYTCPEILAGTAASYEGTFNGTGTTNTVEGSNSWYYRTFMKYDISGFTLPDDAVIDHVYFKMYCNYWNDNASSSSANICRVTNDWDETITTWAGQPTFDSSVKWLSEDKTAPTKNSWGSWDIKDLFEKWYDGTYPNYGFMIFNNDEASSGWRKNWSFYNRRYNDGEYATKLVIEYHTKAHYEFYPTGNTVYSTSLAAIDNYGSSTISWKSQIYDASATNLDIYTSIDQLTWAQCTNGSAIPSLVSGTDYSDKTLYIKAAFSTTNPLITPCLSKLSISIRNITDDKCISANLPSGIQNSLRNANSNVAVHYRTGPLAGTYQAVKAFDMSFTPTGLTRMDNPVETEHISASITGNGTLTTITYIDGSNTEHIDANVSGNGVLTDITYIDGYNTEYINANVTGNGALTSVTYTNTSNAESISGYVSAVGILSAVE